MSWATTPAHCGLVIVAGDVVARSTRSSVIVFAVQIAGDPLDRAVGHVGPQDASGGLVKRCGGAPGYHSSRCPVASGGSSWWSWARPSIWCGNRLSNATWAPRSPDSYEGAVAKLSVKPTGSLRPLARSATSPLTPKLAMPGAHLSPKRSPWPSRATKSQAPPSTQAPRPHRAARRDRRRRRRRSPCGKPFPGSVGRERSG